MRRINKSMITIVSMVLILVSILAATSSVKAQFIGFIGGTFIVGSDIEPRTLNPAIDESSPTIWIGAQIYNALIVLNETGSPLPELAQSWEISPDGTVFTFHLVQNVTWHDGVPFTSADVKFTFEQVLRNYSPLGKAIFGSVDHVDIPDNYTAVVHFVGPEPSLFLWLSPYHAVMLPQHIYAGTNILTNPANSNPIGTGPFKFVEWVKNDHVTVEKNPNYWKPGLPPLDRIIIRTIPDKTTMVLALKRGDIDYIPYTMASAEFVALLNTTGINTSVVNSGMSFTSSLWLNKANPILANVTVRKALSYAIDRSAIIDNVVPGLGIPATGPMSSSSMVAWAYNPDVPIYNYNVTMANQLLDQAGYPRGGDGVRFTLRMVVGLFWENPKVGDMIKTQLSAVGIACDVTQLAWAAYSAKVYSQLDYDIAPQRIGPGPDPQSIRQFYDPSFIGTGSIFSNFQNYSNSQVTQLFETAGETLDKVQRSQIYKQIQTILVNEAANVWLYYYLQPVAWSQDFDTDASYQLPELMLKGTTMDTLFWLKGVWIPEYPTILTVVAVMIAATAALLLKHTRLFRKP